MKKAWLGLVCLFCVVLLVACGSTVTPKSQSSQPTKSSSSAHADAQRVALDSATATPAMSIPSQQITPTPTKTKTSSSASGCITYSNDTTRVPAKSGSLAAPYGSAPTSSEAKTLTTQLFQLINRDRAACGLPAFTWNSTLAAGALLHSWNMVHCGFSHTCPDGSQPCQRIANEGYAGQSDCGECIGEAGPYPTPLAGLTVIQESMAHEAVDGWHRIHLFSTTLHSIGIGIYVDSSGYIWFTEDLVS